MKRRPPASPPAPARDRRPAPGPDDRAPAIPVEAVYGLRAGLAVIALRTGDVVQIAYGRGLDRDAEDGVRWAAAQGIPCAELPDAELDRAAGSSHHEGLCVITRPRRWAAPRELAERLVRDGGAVIALDRVRNPYNIGAVLRSAAFFGLTGALLGAPAPHPALAPDAVRVAEGGAEHLILSRTTDLADTLGRLRAEGVRVVGADGASRTSALGFPFERPLVLVLGHEREGLGPRVRAQCDAVVAIHGTSAVESLNVAVAAGVLMAEIRRGRPRGA